MSPTRTIPPEVARRFLAIRHLLAPPRSLPPRPSSVMAVVDRIGSLQFDPLEVAGRNHDLVLLARIDGYRREMTDRLLYEKRVLYETYNKGLSIVPTKELPWYRVTWDANRVEHDSAAFREHAPLVQELLERIGSTGPMSAIDIKPRAAIDWYWRPTNQVRAILEALAQSGVLALARRDGNRRIYDLAERLFPDTLLAERRTEDEQRVHKLLSRFRAHGLLGASGQAEIWIGTHRRATDRVKHRRALIDSGEITPVAVEGIKGDRYVVTAELPLLDRAAREVAAGRPPNGHPPGVAFLAPLDPLVWDRRLLATLFGFDYVWEVYVPAAKRRWGYYVLPILYGDRIVGRIEPRIERATKTLRIVGLWWEAGFDPLLDGAFPAALAGAIEAHRAFGRVEKVVWPRSTRARALANAVKPLLG